MSLFSWQPEPKEINWKLHGKRWKDEKEIRFSFSATNEKMPPLKLLCNLFLLLVFILFNYFIVLITYNSLPCKKRKVTKGLPEIVADDFINEICGYDSETKGQKLKIRSPNFSGKNQRNFYLIERKPLNDYCIKLRDVITI